MRGIDAKSCVNSEEVVVAQLICGELEGLRFVEKT